MSQQPRDWCSSASFRVVIKSMVCYIEKTFRKRRCCLASVALAAFMLSSSSDCATAGEPQFLTQTRQLTFEGKRSGEGYFSPDGKSLIFQSERDPENPFYQIFLLDLETGDTH